ncbi:MAG: DUF547 domain-containing protein, partial [Parvularculaceae bacterium]|nr:DUF547 domain-containing protein [Parvularculaceae bacterium]
LAFVFVFAALFAPARAADLSRFSRFDSASTTVIDHSAWTAFLARHVKAPAAPGEPARVAYAAATSEDKAALAAYLDTLQAVRPTTLRREEAFAYWINLYNAATVKLILDNYPVSSIMKIRGRLFSIGPWDRKAATVEGVDLSFNDIEHKILRAYFNDNRVHYALNCASIGCPDLKAEAWTAASLDADLDAAARRYVNSPRGVRVENGKLVASSIYQWFGGDFGGTDEGRLAHFRRYADPSLAAALAGATSVRGYGYDWKLNEAR